MTLRNIAYLSVLALSILASLILNNPYGSMPLFVLIGLVVMSAIYALIVRSLFAFTENNASKICIRGTAFKYQFKLANDSMLFFPYIRAIIFTGSELVTENFSVMPHKTEVFETEFKFQHIGKYEVGFLTAKVYDLFEIFSIKYENENFRRSVIVEPQILKLEQLLSIKPDDDPKRDSAFSIFKSYNSGNYGGVREYIPGDSQRSIHWKLTAHTGKYMSRVYKSTDNSAISVYVDLYPPELNRESTLYVYDSLIETALAIANYGTERNCAAEFIYSRKGQMVNCDILNFADIKSLAHNFAEYSFDSGWRIEELLKNNRDNRQGYDNVAVCTPNLSYDLVYYIAELKNLGKNPMLFYILPRYRSLDGESIMLEYLAGSGIEVKFILSSDPAEDVS